MKVRSWTFAFGSYLICFPFTIATIIAKTYQLGKNKTIFTRKELAYCLQKGKIDDISVIREMILTPASIIRNANFHF